MILVDTSVWVSFLKAENQEVTSIMKTYLKKGQVFTVSSVFGELFSNAKNKRELEILRDFWAHMPKINENELFIKAGRLSNKHDLLSVGIGLTDCYILAAAFDNDFALWTFDEKMLSAFEHIQENQEKG